ncbi:NAD(P)/FAD-dependent oxidoreductase [Wenyingzhuangia sp. IMCC45467]
MMKTLENHDVIIIGGSYAGLSAAMTLGRSLRNVLIIDSGLPCNRQTPKSHNVITLDGKKPSEIALQAKDQVLKYNSVNFLEDVVTSAKKTNENFHITTKSGNKFIVKKIIFATGIKDIMPNIKGFSNCWGISVVHCPYCHGYEIRNQKTAIISNGEQAIHLTSLVSNLTDDLIILTNGKSEFDENQIKKLKKNNIRIIEKEITEIDHENGNIKTIIFKDESKEHFKAAYASLPFVQHSDIPKSLGCELTDLGHIKVDLYHKTTVEGVYACGDNSVIMRTISNALNSGVISGAMINKELTQEKW